VIARKIARKEDQVAAAVAQAAEGSGGIDVCVNNASAQRLRANAVGFFGTLAQSVSDIGPRPSAALVVPLVFVLARNGSWLSWVLVTAVLLCVAFCCAELAKRYATTGGLIGLVAITGLRTPALAVARCALGFAILGSPANVLGTGILFQH
jgi:NAD(P)-dependent dehydrogenase (short-subunit alcohol dehydrogenase family)